MIGKIKNLKILDLLGYFFIMYTFVCIFYFVYIFSMKNICIQKYYEYIYMYTLYVT
jgi:hypothetical protein